jgi:nitroreductase
MVIVCRYLPPRGVSGIRSRKGPLAAADLGIGSCHAGVADLPLARELLGFPEDRDWALLISLGYPADRPLVPVRRPSRRPFGEVVHRGRW